MVIGVKKRQRFLLQKHEYSVDQLNIFGEIVEIVQCNQWFCPSSSMITDCEKYPVPPDRWH